ncbi:hypothetical protein GGS21DRAFT_535041 [Xylaria nigripes]|nr:hypothetical protein GGS21DRAFT_535041 [Xylaria nigripes]
MSADNSKKTRGNGLGNSTMVPRAKVTHAPASSAVEPVVRASSHMPRGYKFVPKGNPYMTRNCRQQTQQAHQVVYAVVDSKKKQIGIRVPRTIYATVLKSETETRTERQQAVRKRDRCTEKCFSEAVLAKFPRIPRERLPTIIDHATEKRKGRVGRTGKIEMDDKVHLAVQAHIRHHDTNYEELLEIGVNRQEARAMISQRVREKLKEWGATPRTKSRKSSKK